MNRSFRFASIFVLFAAAMFAFTSSAYASQRTSFGPAKVVTYQNGTRVTYTNGMKFVQPYGKHAQVTMQRRDAQGRWSKAVAFSKSVMTPLVAAARLRH